MSGSPRRKMDLATWRKRNHDLGNRLLLPTSQVKSTLFYQGGAINFKAGIQRPCVKRARWEIKKLVMGS